MKESAIRKFANMYPSDEKLEQAVTEIITKEPNIIFAKLFMLLTWNRGKGKQHISAHLEIHDGQTRAGENHVVHRKGNGHWH